MQDLRIADRGILMGLRRKPLGIDSFLKSPSLSFTRKISRLFEAVAILIDRDIWHAATARDDESREV